MAGMRDRTAKRNYSPAAEEFRREHERHRKWGKDRRHAERLRQLHEASASASASARSLAATAHRQGSESVPSRAPEPAVREQRIGPPPSDDCPTIHAPARRAPKRNSQPATVENPQPAPARTTQPLPAKATTSGPPAANRPRPAEPRPRAFAATQSRSPTEPQPRPDRSPSQETEPKPRRDRSRPRESQPELDRSQSQETEPKPRERPVPTSRGRA
jgi:hypothetical protein